MTKEEVFVFGAGGHAKVVMAVLERQGLYEITGLFDDRKELAGRNIYGYRVLGDRDCWVRGGCRTRRGIVAIGDNRLRAEIARWLEEQGAELISAVHPSAQIARGVVIGAGTVLMPGTVINCETRLGKNAVVNTGATIDHDCLIEDAVHIAPGATLCGGVSVRQGAFVCAGATVIPGVTIGAHSVVAAGATVTGDIGERLTVGGTPAREIGAHRA